MEITRHQPGPRMSQAVSHGDTVYLAGQVDGHLAAAGTDKSRLLSAQIWLSDIRFYDEMNAAWDAWVDPQNTPARATGESRLAAHDVKVEIIVTAAR